MEEERRRRVELCALYWTAEGCQEWVCKKLHLCRYFLQTRCANDTDCKWSHSVQDEHNARVFKAVDLSHVSIQRLKYVYKTTQAAPKPLPEACKFYNGIKNGCKHRDGSRPGCPCLHICKFYILGNCKYGERCNKSHTLTDPQPSKILMNYQIDVFNCDQQRLVNDLKSFFCQLEEQSFVIDFDHPSLCDVDQLLCPGNLEDGEIGDFFQQNGEIAAPGPVVLSSALEVRNIPPSFPSPSFAQQVNETFHMLLQGPPPRPFGHMADYDGRFMESPLLTCDPNNVIMAPQAPTHIDTIKEIIQNKLTSERSISEANSKDHDDRKNEMTDADYRSSNIRRGTRPHQNDQRNPHCDGNFQRSHYEEHSRSSFRRRSCSPRERNGRYSKLEHDYSPSPERSRHRGRPLLETPRGGVHDSHGARRYSPRFHNDSRVDSYDRPRYGHISPDEDSYSGRHYNRPWNDSCSENDRRPNDRVSIKRRDRSSHSYCNDRFDNKIGTKPNEVYIHRGFHATEEKRHVFIEKRTQITCISHENRRSSNERQYERDRSHNQNYRKQDGSWSRERSPRYPHSYDRKF